MAIVTKTTAFNANTGAYVQLNSDIQGEVMVTFRPNQDIYLVQDPAVTNATTANSNESTKSIFIAAGGAGYTGYTLRLDPCKTWIRAFGGTGGNLWAHYSW